MGIKSTKNINRKAAIGRIIEIYNLIAHRDYNAIEKITSESDYNLQKFVDNTVVVRMSDIKNWTDHMLEDKIDEPFFRHSMFDNYFVTAE